MSELSCPMTQYRTTLYNDTVSQNYLTQWRSVPELSHPMTECHTVPISPNYTVSQNYLTQWHSVTLSWTISPNDTVSQNYLIQWHSVPNYFNQWHSLTLSWTISPNDTVSHCPRTPESSGNSTSKKTAVPIFKQQTPVYKTVWHHSPKDCNFNVKFWSLTSILFVLTWTWHCQFAITNLPVWRLVGVYFDTFIIVLKWTKSAGKLVPSLQLRS